MAVAIIAITRNGAKLGKRLQSALPDSDLFVLEKYAGEESHPFSEKVSALAERLWEAAEGIVFIMATGIVVRTIAPLLQGKDKDPAVVVLDEAGAFAISLLSGHLGGANALAQLCADQINATAVITTATDVNGLPSFDMLAKEMGWHIEELSQVKILNALLLEDKEIAVVDQTDQVRSYFRGRGRLSFFDTVESGVASGAEGVLLVTNRTIPDQCRREGLLILRPRNLCLGIGCNRGTTTEEIESVVMAQLERLELSSRSVKTVASAEAKKDEAGLLAFVEKWGSRVIFYASEELNSMEIPSPPSEHAFAAIGARGVAEPAALLASQGGRLLCNKIKDGNVTVAVAEMAGIGSQ